MTVLATLTVCRSSGEQLALLLLGNGPNTVLESTVSNTELSEFRSAYYLCAKASSPSFSQTSPSLPLNSVSALFRNSTLETLFLEKF